MKPYRVCLVSELPPGECKIVEIEGRSIGVFNVGGSFYALKNSCPHQFAPLCLGKITGYNRPSDVGTYEWCREGEIIRCPWHAWEFDITTGQSVFNPFKVRTRAFAVSVRAEEPDETASVEVFKVTLADKVVFVSLQSVGTISKPALQGCKKEKS